MQINTRIIGFRNAFLLLLWGTLILWIARRGTLSTYLHPSLQPFAIIAGALLVVMALFSVRGIRRSDGESHGCCCDHDHGHDADHHHGSGGAAPVILKFLLLALLPLWVVFSGETRFTMTTIQNRGVVADLAQLPSARSSAASSSTAAPPVAPLSGGPMPLQVIDMLYGIQMPSYREEFEGKEVEMTAQFVPMTTGNPKGDRFQAVRMFITCCAADAKPVGVTVRSSSIPKVSEMGWVKIIGKPTFPMEGGRRTAVLEAFKVEPCEAPPEPFVY